MSSSSDSTYGHRSSGYCWGSRGNWSGFNIAAMVVGFVLFWPIGLLILYWIARGRSVKDLPAGIRRQWSKFSGQWQHGDGVGAGSSENVVFNEFQQTQYDRIREIKDEIKERSRRFAEFRANAKRRADEEEFNRFMDEVPGRNDV